MAWTTPITWVDTTVYNQTHFDQQLKDNLGFLYSPPSCLTANNANQNLTHNTTTNVSMQTEHWDTNTMHGATLYRHDINTAGTFIIFGAGAFSLADLDGSRSIELSVSGGAPQVRMTIPAVSGLANTPLQVAHTGLMTTADYIDLQAYQNSGSTLPVLAGTAWMLSHWCGNP